MTREEAISILKQYIDYNNPDVTDFYTMEEAIEVVIKALQQEPCTDAISRNKVIVQLSHLLSDWDDDWNVAIRKCIETVKGVQPVTPAEKVGQWIEHFDESGKWYECDQCHTDWGGSVNYCPNCGAKMGGTQHDD